ncbi:hypothetical protein ACOMHN_029062 [Nucella lapillus]
MMALALAKSQSTPHPLYVLDPNGSKTTLNPYDSPFTTPRPSPLTVAMATGYNASSHFRSPAVNLTLCGGGPNPGQGPNCSSPSPPTNIVPGHEKDDDEVIWTPDVIQRVASLAFLMALTVVGNTAILAVLTCSRYRQRNSRVNLFLIHLALGDLAVCVCTMTTEILFVAFGQWVLGPVACKVLTYLQIVTLASTTFILTSMSFDRYLAICKPLKCRGTTWRAKKFIAASWLLAFVLAVPQLFIFVQTTEPREDGTMTFGCKSRGYTQQWQRKVYFTFLTIYILIVPVALITFCYTSIVCVVSRVSQDVQQSNLFNSNGLRRSVDNSTFPRAKIKTLKMTFAIIATFVLCWTPYFVTTLISIYSDYTVHIPPAVMVFAETVALLQSGLNPLLYGCFTLKIKRGLADVFCRYRLTSPRWAPSFNKSGAVTESYSMTEMDGAHFHYHHGNGLPGSRNCSARMRDSASNPSNSSSSAAAADGKPRVITEENKHGVRLRVRFAPKEVGGVPPGKVTDKAASSEALGSGVEGNGGNFPKQSCLKVPAAGYYQ